MEQKFVSLFNDYKRGLLDRRQFLTQLTVIAGGVAGASSLLPVLGCDKPLEESTVETERLMARYAEVLLVIGLDLQNNQILHIQAPTVGREAVIQIIKKAYEMGASRVFIDWSDGEADTIHMEKANPASFDEFPGWETMKMDELVKQGACFLILGAPFAGDMSKVDVEVIQRIEKAKYIGLKGYNNARSAFQLSYCIACIANEKWAEKVFPALERKKALKKLWEYIFKCTHVDENNPVEIWKKKQVSSHKRARYLSSKQYAALHFISDKTDLEVKLPSGHIWVGGGITTSAGRYILPNIPTEENATVPHRLGVNGVVHSTKPLAYKGKIVDGFYLKLRDGRIIEYGAEVGEDILKAIIETDEGSSYLGEVAIVDNDSPISRLNTTFYTTLFDENASCHLAIGASYAMLLKGAAGKSEEEQQEMGANHSSIHVDFMIGSEKMNIYGIQKEGTEEMLVKDGSWIDLPFSSPG